MEQRNGRPELSASPGDGPTATTHISIGQVVADLQAEFPEISHSSLRFLEREGLLTPQRTQGGHRLFTPQDVARVRQIKRWQEQRLSLDEIRDRLTTREASPMARLTEHLASELLHGHSAAVPELLHADDLGVPLPVLFQDVLLQVQREVGRRWQQGEIRVGQEHEITETLREVIAQLSWRHAVEPEGLPILAACPTGEHHDVGLRMVVGLLRARGRQVHFLGSNVDTPFLIEEVRTRQPAVTLLSATLPARYPALRDLFEQLRGDPATREIPIMVGGGIAHVMELELTRLGAIPSRESDLISAVDTIMQLYEQQCAVRENVVVTA